MNYIFNCVINIFLGLKFLINFMKLNLIVNLYSFNLELHAMNRQHGTFGILLMYIPVCIYVYRRNFNG